jgi:hypothetical protein
MRDFAITENHVIWFDLSATLGLQSSLPFPPIWNERYQARVGDIGDRPLAGASGWPFRTWLSIMDCHSQIWIHHLRIGLFGF